MYYSSDQCSNNEVSLCESQKPRIHFFYSYICMMSVSEDIPNMVICLLFVKGSQSEKILFKEGGVKTVRSENKNTELEIGRAHPQCAVLALLSVEV